MHSTCAPFAIVFAILTAEWRAANCTPDLLYLGANSAGRKWPYGQAVQWTASRGTAPLSRQCLEALKEISNVTVGQHGTHTKLDRNDAHHCAVFDAMGKPGSGLIRGNLFWYGDFDECQNMEGMSYCLNMYQANLSALSTTEYKPVEVGICMPSKCTEQDAVNFLWGLDEVVTPKWSFEYTFLKVKMAKAVEPNSTVTVCSKRSEFTAATISSLIIISALVLILLAGSVCDWYLSGIAPSMSTIGRSQPEQTFFSHADHRDINSASEETMLLGNNQKLTGAHLDNSVLYHDRYHMHRPLQLLRCFSVQRNLLALLDTHHPTGTIPCLCGLRVLMMWWIILGHTHLWPQYIGCSNVEEMWDMSSRFTFQLVLNSTFAIDSFFLISGLLVMFLTWRQLDVDGGSLSFGRFFLRRVFRLTPTYMFVLMLWTNIVMYWGNSPNWPSRMDDRQACTDYWWTNFFYINNFWPSNLVGSCIGWTWYLANDMQFYIMSSFVILLVYRARPFGLLLIGLLLVGSLVTTAVLVYIYKFNIDGRPGSRIMNDIFTHLSKTGANFQSVVFDKPYCRAPPYLVGLFVGYLLRQRSMTQLNFRRRTKYLLALGWALACLLCLVPIYSLYGVFHEKRLLPLIPSIFYHTFARLSWSLGIAWVVFACFAEYGGYLNSILSHGVWLPLSRLTFSTYLIHPIILQLLFLGLKKAVFYTDVAMIAYYLGALVFSYAAALIIAVAVEFPFLEIERLLFRSKRFT